MKGNLITMSISYKTCNRCNQYLPLNHFSKNRGMKDGHFNQCKPCRRLIKKKKSVAGDLGKSEENRRYFAENKERIKRLRRNRYASDIDFRVSCNLRNRLSKMMRGKIKSGSAVKDLGCSVEQFKKYLESLFKPGMSWENYGFGKDKWNIDHILPLSKFNLSERDQFLRACHYSNLQPLWHIENIKKSDIIKS